MITYMKELYPELNESDFEKYIVPILGELDKLPVFNADGLKNVKSIVEREDYPYHNCCKIISKCIWDRFWNSELDQYILDLQTFRNISCEALSQLIFSYLIRSFAKQIKNIPEGNRNSKEMYDYYNSLLISTHFRDFANDYPVVWGRCYNAVKNRVNAIIETIKLIQMNRLELEKEFNIKRDSKIKDMKFGGDTHNKGSAVSIITFECGNKIIFKPRSVSCEQAYSRLIDKINNFISPKMSAMKAIDHGYYGFTSFVDMKDNYSDMYQAGRLACLMYFLNATDMHYSNILWSNDGPVPIDLETLFHPARVREGILQSPKSAYRYLETSVFATGILPLILSSKNNNGSVDVGFTGIRDEYSSSPFKNYDIIDGFSSDIRVVWKESKVDNRLSEDKELAAYIHDRCEKIVSGFKDLFMQIFARKDEFCDIVLECFEDSKIRYIQNMTYRYIQLLRCLVDSEPAKNIEISRALLSRVAILDTSSDNNIVVSECEQLWRGDVPYFYVKFNGNELFNEDKVISNITMSPKDEFILKMNKLSEKELDKQIELIRLAFLAKLADTHEESKVMECDIKKSLDLYNKNKVEESKIKDIIRWFANELVDSSFDDRYAHLPMTWIGPVVKYSNPAWTPGVLGYDLYAGRVGPALALTAASKVLGDDSFKEVAYNVFERSAKIFQAKTYELRNVLISGTGAFSGVSGLVWSLGAAGNIINNNEWTNASDNAWDLLPDFMTVDKPDFFDMIMGSSASIVMRYRVQKNWKLSEENINKCVELAKLKIANSLPNTTSGLAHGYSHLLWFFSIIAQKEHSQNVEDIIKQIDEIIREKYTCNGYIQVYCGATDKVSSSWCNGLAGVLIAYYESYKANVLPAKRVIDIINQLKEIPLSSIPIICHGSLGICEAIEYVSKDFYEYTQGFLSNMKATICNPEYIFSYYKEGKGRYPLSPGLMAGKAGALLYLCKEVDSTINSSPLTFGI